MSKTFLVWIDGASRGNPGKAGMGVLIKNEDGEILSKISEYLGDDLTNNQAEYSALVKALKSCLDLGGSVVRVFSDSKLVVNQMIGEYAVKSSNIKHLYEKAKELESKFRKVEYQHVSRGENPIADDLANEAIDSRNT